MKPWYPLVALVALTLASAAHPRVAEAGIDPVAPDRTCLPLKDGNLWRYVCTAGPEPVVVEVRAWVPEVVPSYVQDGYYVVDNYLFGIAPGSLELVERDGNTCEHKAGDFYMFYPWSDLNSPVVIPKLVEDCMHGSVGVFEPLKSITVPAGRFEDVLSIRYTDLSCYDAGPGREVFAPGIGLVQRTTLSIAGVRTWSLYYAEVDGYIYGTPSVPSSRSATASREGQDPAEASSWSGVKSRFR